MILLDTHAFLWFLTDDSRLPAKIKDKIETDKDVFVSIASFIPNWNRYNEKLQKGEIDEEEYQMWLDDTLSLFNVPIDEYLIKK